MSNVKIAPWPFNDLKVKLLWFGNVFQKNQKWRIQVGFEVNGKSEILDFPVGLLPLFRIGQWYYNGTPLSTQKEGILSQVKVLKFDQGQIMDSLGACRAVGYYLHGQPNLMKNKLWAFSVDNVIYYVPFIELLRVLFATGKDVSNAIFRPNGLNYLIDQVTHVGNSIEILFSKEVPKSSLEDDFIRHIAWVLSDDRVYASFESVFSYIYAQNGRQFGVSLEIALPALSELELYYRGIVRSNEVLILEILGIDGLDDNLEIIDVRHPLLKEKMYVPGTKKRVYSQKNPDIFEIQTQTSDIPKKDSDQPVVKTDATRLGFNNETLIRKFKVPSQIIHQGNEFTVIPGRGGAVVVAGVDESVDGGKLQPLNVKSLEIGVVNQETGLEDFLKMIKYLSTHYKDLKIDISLIELPSHRRFAYLDTGEKRKCAVVKIMRNNRTTYVLEIARPDEHLVTTLLLYPDNYDQKDHDEKIQQILRKLSFKQGHWPLISEFVRSKKLKHTKKLHFEWAKRLYFNID